MTLSAAVTPIQASASARSSRKRVETASKQSPSSARMMTPVDALLLLSPPGPNDMTSQLCALRGMQ